MPDRSHRPAERSESSERLGCSMADGAVGAEFDRFFFADDVEPETLVSDSRPPADSLAADSEQCWRIKAGLASGPPPRSLKRRRRLLPEAPVMPGSGLWVDPLDGSIRKYSTTRRDATGPSPSSGGFVIHGY